MIKKNFAKKLYFRYMLSLLWTIVILYLSLVRIETGDVPKFHFPHLDKIAHFSMYFIYTFLLLLESKKCKQLKTNIIIVAYAIFFGAVMELLQEFLFTYRSGDLYDAIFNALGAISMTIFFPKLIEIKKKIF